MLPFTSNILGSKLCLEAKTKQFDGSQPLPIFSGSYADTGLDLQKQRMLQMKPTVLVLYPK